MKKGLGKGLAALIENNIDESSNIDSDEFVVKLNIEEVVQNKNQPRKNFDEDKLNELADSIREHGVIQPIIVKKMANNYQIIAGERRFRASKLAGLSEIPAIVKDYNPKEIMEIALIENIQRENLNPIEEAEAYQKLIDALKVTHDELSRKVGKSRTVITNSLRLLKLSDKVKAYVVENKIPGAAARSILSLETPVAQDALADIIIEKGLSVREIEAYVQNRNASTTTKTSKRSKSSNKFKSIEDDLKNSLGTKVIIKQGNKKGKIEIEYYNDDDLERIIGMILK